MAFLAPALPYIMATVAGVTAYGQYQQGEAAMDAAKLQALQLRMRANNERALAQQEAEQKRREMRYAQSRAQAVAAASGAGASDPTVVDLMGDLEETGEYEALSALWSGENQARESEFAARVAKYEGKLARKKARTKALTTVLSTAVSMGMRYGGGLGGGANAEGFAGTKGLNTTGLSMDSRNGGGW